MTQEQQNAVLEFSSGSTCLPEGVEIGVNPALGG